ncbi:MAG: acetyl-CoA carboxylase, carboxyltransferase subunit beta [Candidatus Edwardsbacteria bacterium]
MAWFKKEKRGITSEEKRSVPDGLWIKCDDCGEIIYRKELDKNLWVCPKCQHHFRFGYRQYLEILLDDGKLQEFNANLSASDPLNFPEYKAKYKKASEKLNIKEGTVTAETTIGGYPVVFAITDFEFMGGSMGSVVGEKISQAIKLALEKRIPLIILTASGGGARMQEGILSLMQMAKTSARLAELAKAGVPYIGILTDPTMAGVMASFASLGDIIIAEPKALLGFTGPRVIEQTVKQTLPPGFQRSEFLLEHGMVDLILDRRNLRETLINILKFFSK